MPQCKCGSYAINHHHHGRDGGDGHLCDVCYWRTRAELLRAERDALAKALEPFTGNATHYGAGGIYTLGVYGRDLIAARAALAQIEQERSEQAKEDTK